MINVGASHRFQILKDWAITVIIRPRVWTNFFFREGRMADILLFVRCRMADIQGFERGRMADIRRQKSGG